MRVLIKTYRSMAVVFIGLLMMICALECWAQQWLKPMPPRFTGAYVVRQAAKIKTAPLCSPVVLTGNIVEQLSYTRYVFKDRSGTAILHIPQYVFGLNRVYADTKVRLTGQILGKHPIEFYDPHARILYLEIIQ